MGCWRRVQKKLDNGSLVKVRLDNQGIASGLYETELKPMHKLALSGQFDATNMEKPPKVCVLSATFEPAGVWQHVPFDLALHVHEYWASCM